jgi:hypothetical protein
MACLLNRRAIENAQLIAAHESPLYDRAGAGTALDDVERIGI